MSDNMKQAADDAASTYEQSKELESHLKLVLSDPYMFDENEIKEIDLEGLFNLTAGELCTIDRQMMAKGYTGARMDISRQYAMLVAAKVNGKPWEFCDQMKARDSIRLRDMVTAFFYARA